MFYVAIGRVVKRASVLTSICSFGKVKCGPLVLISVHVHDILNSQWHVRLHGEGVWLQTIMSEPEGPQPISVGGE